MYPNVRAEMARKNVTQRQLAQLLGVRPSTISQKLSGKAPLNLYEAFEIKKALNTRLSIDVLFMTEPA